MKIANIYIKVAQRVKTLRLQKGFSQERLAIEAGLERSYISSIERGQKRPTLETIEKIVNTLEVPLVKVFHFEEN